MHVTGFKPVLSTGLLRFGGVQPDDPDKVQAQLTKLLQPKSENLTLYFDESQNAFHVIDSSKPGESTADAFVRLSRVVKAIKGMKPIQDAQYLSHRMIHMQNANTPATQNAVQASKAPGAFQYGAFKVYIFAPREHFSGGSGGLY